MGISCGGMKQIIQQTDPVVLVGGGQATPEDLHKALNYGTICVAADGGAVLAIAADVNLTAVIGDFDSIPDAVKSQIPHTCLHHFAEQDSTDFDKALSRITAPVVIGVGFTGGRLDHQLAVFHGLMRFADRPCVLLGETEIMLLAPPDISLPTQEGDVVSLFPLAPVGGTSTGLKWPIDGLAFETGRFVGTSNVATGPCRITMQGAGMLMILPRRLIQPVVASLSHADHVRWPVRAG